MKLAVLFSGGKDSVLAMHKAGESNEIVCLISIVSSNKESFMFHVPNISITSLQAEAIELPLIQKETAGKKEEELKDLFDAVKEAKEKFKIQGVVTGAIKSVYQADRIQKICNELGLECINPLWQKDQKEILEEVIKRKFKVIIAGIFAYPLDKTVLGKEIDSAMIDTLEALSKKCDFNIAGEGGEIETTVLDAPLFKKKIEIQEAEISYSNHAGTFEIKKAVLAKKA